MLQVIAQSIQPSVLAGSALHVGEHRRAHLPDQSPGGIYQGQAFLDLFVCQAVSGDKRLGYGNVMIRETFVL